ncbi:MAG: hypothetical protein HYV36_07075 [Lentisphaerae bacterium]|nr:hypothetical protein [Lentisphaerota bacterium]
MRLKLIASLIVMLVGCRANQVLPLTFDPEKNSAIMKEYIPIGTALVEVQERMRRADFQCNLKRNERLYTEKTGGFTLNGPKFDFLMCSRGEYLGNVSKREAVIQQVFFILNAENKVQDIVTSCERPEKW